MSGAFLRAARVRHDGWTDTVPPERFQEARFRQLLGVERDASDAEIKKAYRHFAMTYHPDHNNGDREAEEKFKQITEAYEVLCELRDLPSPEDMEACVGPDARKAEGS